MKIFLVVSSVIFIACISNTYSQALYFPPVTGNTWDTISPVSLGWCPDKIDTLTQYLDDKNTKGFIILKDGKIVIERYYGTFTQDSIWYWASAGKSLTAFLTGKAQQDGFLNINDTVSDYLGSGWTSCTTADEQKITIRNQLSMTTGFDDAVPDPDCTIDTCLTCIDIAGNRWSYHNAPYHLIHDVLENATGNTLNFYTYSQLSFQTGITGAWLDHVFYSTTRNMARFGLLTLARGIWNTDTILSDTSYFQQMLNSSQVMNPSYGYLWWLNGKGSYMAPQSQFVFQTDLVPNAPDEMVAALGKNDQKIYVVPSQNLVVVRMGNNSGNIPVLAISSFDNELWEKLNDVFCGTLSINNNSQTEIISAYPNPSDGNFQVRNLKPGKFYKYYIFDTPGKKVAESVIAENNFNIDFLPPGMYSLLIEEIGGNVEARQKLILIK